MTSEELAKEVMNAVVAVQSRILGVGKEQYDQGSEQQFERMSLQEIADYAREEAEDLIAYGVMLRYKINNLKAAFEVAFNGYQPSEGKHAKSDEALAEMQAKVNLTLGGVQAAEEFHAFQPTDWPSLKDAAEGVR